MNTKIMISIKNQSLKIILKTIYRNKNINSV